MLVHSQNTQFLAKLFVNKPIYEKNLFFLLVMLPTTLTPFKLILAYIAATSLILTIFTECYASYVVKQANI